ncbi:methionine aminotransferase [Fulvivirga lutea]|uniref:Aminotransferase class I/II-fold pyridoxal phosphate-dependent enzyme n=1 Tax=Fulvivirga lutea TaxID=2810512 RepID=A0A974WHP9_9BACT|nr:methionine aminotransferase [Fulvivirga lutea]QSE97928.1 aminotransferase class I/II-fold pyridoxal phosphate-dependent enzyme [Fulvivirga lutea]
MQLQSKLPDVGTTIFAVMSKMALDHHAINLSQGFPDFPISDKLIQLVNKYMEAGKNQYAPMPGVPELRSAISKVIEDKYGYLPNPETEITVTAGATEAIYATLAALVNEGDEVILFDPAYDCYDPSIRLNGGIPIHLTLKQPDFSIDWNKVEESITHRTRVIMVNTPHNPSGAVLNHEDLKTLEELAIKHDLIVISDEVYEHIIFGHSHESALKYEGLSKRCVAIYSFGKTFHATGWKSGYIIAPDYLTKEIRKVHQFLVFSVNTPVQYALAEFLNDRENYIHISDMYEQKRNVFQEALKDSRFEVIPCHGTYFQLLSYKGISDLDDMSMAEKLTKGHKVASIPISVFYQNKQDDKLLRFCFAKNEDTLLKAADILCKI